MVVILWILSFLVGIQYFITGFSVITQLQKKVVEVKGPEHEDLFSEIFDLNPIHGCFMLFAWPIVMCCQLITLWVLSDVKPQEGQPNFFARQAKKIEEK